MIKLIFGIIIGFISAIIAFCLIENNNKYGRNCKNCNHSVPATGKDGNVYFYCNLSEYTNISNFPVKDYNCCGHFDYTNELKTEQVKDKAEKLIKK